MKNQIASLKKVGTGKPQMWIAWVSGKQILVPRTEQLLDQRRFRQLCFEEGVLPDLLSFDDWEKSLQTLSANCETVPYGYLWGER
jgi:hypothetical protein